MRLVFMGTPDFAIPSLKSLIDHRYDICTVVTVPDKPAGRGLHPAASPVKRFALDHRIPLLEPASIRDQGFIDALVALRPDCAVVVAFRILPREVYSIPRLGTFNLHASLLPKYRGAAPINWAIINGETETGVTTFFLRESVDTGDVILRKSVPIGPDENAGELHDRLALKGAEAVLETVRLIESGKVVTCAQDHSLATPAPKIFTGQCRIDWRRKAPDLHNFIRGLAPRPGAFTTLDGRILKIFMASISDLQVAGEPGKVIIDGERWYVGAGKGFVELLEVQTEGKKRLSAGEFVRGRGVRSGDILGS